MSDIAEQWRNAFWQIIRQPEIAQPLQEATLNEHLGAWTKLLTSGVVATCIGLGWQASAKGHALDLLPVPRGEYLALDVIAFPAGQRRWRFPVAVAELENRREDDYIAYSLWKVLCVRANLRIVFCYRRTAGQGATLMRSLQTNVIEAMSISERAQLEGQTLVVVGSRAESETFPYGFFKWWELETNTGNFRPVI